MQVVAIDRKSWNGRLRNAQNQVKRKKQKVKNELLDNEVISHKKRGQPFSQPLVLNHDFNS